MHGSAKGLSAALADMPHSIGLANPIEELVVQRIDLSKPEHQFDVVYRRQD
jgi:hypothetical protein